MSPYRTVPFACLLAADCAERLILLACAFALRSPAKAKAYARTALSEAKRAQRPDLAYNANELMGALS